MSMTRIIAVSGIKNSGKTTLISRIIPELKKKGLKIATIKHDGHDFQPDVEGTDSFIHRKSGADSVAIFSQNRWMIIKEEANKTELDLIEEFSDFDLIILEGFKYSDYPKIEVVRSEISNKPVAKKETVLAYVTDLDIIDRDIKQFGLEDIEDIGDYIYSYLDIRR